MKDPLRNIPGYILSRASSAVLLRLNQHLKPIGIRHVDASILLLIETNPGITQSQIGRILDIQRANMVPFIARLESRNWLTRTPAAGRAQGLALSDEGERALKVIKNVMDEQEAALIAKIPVERRKEFLAFLRALWLE